MIRTLSCALLLALPISAQTNLLTNGDFSGGTQPWVFYGKERSLTAQQDGLRRFADDVLAQLQ